MRIVFDPATVEQGSSASRSITGVIYFDFGTACFPEERWNDFVVVVISWWLEAIEKLEKGIVQDVQLGFMDGPFHIEATCLARDQVRLRCVERRRGEQMQHEELAGLADLRALIRHVAANVALACTRAGMHSADLDNLKRWLPS